MRSLSEARGSGISVESAEADFRRRVEELSMARETTIVAILSNVGPSSESDGHSKRVERANFIKLSALTSSLLYLEAAGTPPQSNGQSSSREHGRHKNSNDPSRITIVTKLNLDIGIHSSSLPKEVDTGMEDSNVLLQDSLEKEGRGQSRSYDRQLICAKEGQPCHSQRRNRRCRRMGKLSAWRQIACRR